MIIILWNSYLIHRKSSQTLVTIIIVIIITIIIVTLIAIIIIFAINP